MANLFNSIKVPKLKRNKFNLSHDICLTSEFGKLVPILCEEVLPGETYKLSTQQLVRLAPLKAPYMSAVDVYTYSFFVPNRLIWKGWKDFITGKDESLIHPYLKVNFVQDHHTPFSVFTKGKSNDKSSQSNEIKTSSLIDYLGMPTTDVTDLASDITKGYVNLDPFPLYAYQLIYDEFFRDQNLQPSVTENLELQSGINSANQNRLTTDGNDSLTPTNFYELLQIRNKCWKKDYFTSALTEPQASSDVVGKLPFSGDATAQFDVGTKAPIGYNLHKSTYVRDLGGNLVTSTGDLGTAGSGKLEQGGNQRVLDLKDSNFADLSNLSADINFGESSAVLNINELRRLYRIQMLLERDNRGGGRYVEQLLSHFGVKSSDGRLQRPEFLGGSKIPIIVGEVLQTSESTSNSPLAQPAGNAAAAGVSRQFKRFFEEHGWLITVMCVLPKAYYSQGMPRKFSRSSRFDYYWPEFAHLGEQPILEKEIYYVPDSFNTPQNTNNDVFGYTPRYAEYKFSPSRVCGDFKTNMAFWHLGRMFNSAPRLNSDFVTMKSKEVNRIFAVEGYDEQGNEVNNYDHLWIQVHNDLQKLSPMPKYGTPMF